MELEKRTTQIISESHGYLKIAFYFKLETLISNYIFIKFFMNYRASIIRRASTYGSSPSFKFGSASDLPYLLNSSPSMNLRRFTAKSLLESIETEIEITHDVFWEKISLLNEEQFQILTILIFRKDPSLRRSLEFKSLNLICFERNETYIKIIFHHR